METLEVQLWCLPNKPRSLRLHKLRRMKTRTPTTSIRLLPLYWKPRTKMFGQLYAISVFLTRYKYEYEDIDMKIDMRYKYMNTR